MTIELDTDSVDEKEQRVASATGVAEALGLLWATHCLYPHPLDQPMFLRGIAMLAAADDYPVRIDVGPRGFTAEGEPVRTEREGAERLARQLYTHNVQAVRVQAPPSAEEMEAVFRFVDRSPDDIRAAGGVRAAFAATGARNVELVARSLLVDRDEAPAGRDPAVVELLELGEDPEAFAALLVERAGGGHEELADLFAGWYRDVYERVDAADVLGREDVVRVFVDSYFFLGNDYQVHLLGRLLGERDLPNTQLLLDQFSGHELARLAAQLDDASRQELIAYARLAKDEDDRRPDELLPMLQSAATVRDAKNLVADRVTRVLAGEGMREAGQALHSLRNQVPAMTGVELGTYVLRVLLGIEDREGRLRRVLRLWTGKIARAVRERDLHMARVWQDAVIDDPPYRPEDRPLAREALADLASPELVDIVVDEAARSGDHDGAARLLAPWGRGVVGELVTRMAMEDDVQLRKVVVELLGRLAAIDPIPVIDHLSDPRWFVVRNVVTVLGRSGRIEAADALERAIRHADHRVRSEALRSLTRLDAERGRAAAVTAFADENERVRLAALPLLALSPDPAVDGMLGAALGSRHRQLEELAAIVGALATRPGGRPVVAAVAARSFTFTRRRRAVRTAAREALEARP